MLDVFKSIDDTLFKLEEIEDGAWINLVNPTKEELDFIENKLSIEGDLLRAALDDEESARLETEEGQVLILFDTPYICLLYTSLATNGTAGSEVSGRIKVMETVVEELEPVEPEPVEPAPVEPEPVEEVIYICLLYTSRCV